MKQAMIIIPVFFLFGLVQAQEKLTLNDILPTISKNHPELKSFDAEIRSLDEAAKGAKSWEPPLLSTGLWMTPYNPALWKKQRDGSSGMGQYMVSAEQMFPNSQMQNAQQQYLQSQSAVEKEKKGTRLNELYAQAKKYYFQWVIAKKKLRVLDQDEKLLDFMIKNAELRYKNNLGKISAYYKAKASLGTIQGTRVRLENEMVQKRIALNTLMNREKSIAFDIDTTYRVNDYATYALDSSTLTNVRSDIRALDRTIQLTSLQRDVERAKLKPQFGIRFEHMFGFGGLPMQYSLMGMVRLPMAAWSSRESKANVESLKWKAVSLEQQKQNLLNEAAGAAYGMKLEILSRQRQIRLFEDNIIPALRMNFQTMEIAYENNTEELFELYDAWQTLNMTQLDYLDQLGGLLDMQVEFERILEIK